MTDAAPAYAPPLGCTPSDVERWRALVGAARLLAKRPAAKVPGLRKIIKDGSRAAMPYGDRHSGSVFARLFSQLSAWPPLDGVMKPARAADLGALAEAVAQLLGDPHDEAVAGRMINPVRPRKDLDD
jgi:hypothetical protein